MRAFARVRAPPAGPDPRSENNEPLRYSWWFTESPLVSARCVDTGDEWTERSDGLCVFVPLIGAGGWSA